MAPMNAPESERPDSGWQQRLLAYADGELAATDREQVEQWLLQHPEATNEFRALREFSPRNTAYWQSLEPVQPSESCWSDVWSRSEGRINRNAGRPGRLAGRWRRGRRVA